MKLRLAAALVRHGAVPMGIIAATTFGVIGAEPKTPGPTPALSSSPAAVASAPAYTYTPGRATGFGWRDNDCGGPGDCTAWGDGHAGGDGTWEKPVSLAVGASAPEGLERDARIYIPFLHRYGVVDDRCGACIGVWVDVWVDGRTATRAAAEACMRALTGPHQLILSPPPGLPVDAGTISTAAGCARQYPEVL